MHRQSLGLPNFEGNLLGPAGGAGWCALPCCCLVSSRTANDQFPVGNQFATAASPLLLCILKVCVFLRGAGRGLGVRRPQWGLAWARMDTSVDVSMALPSQAGVRAWDAGGAPCLNKRPRLKLPPGEDGDAPSAKVTGSPWALPLLPQRRPTGLEQGGGSGHFAQC